MPLPFRPIRPSLFWMYYFVSFDSGAWHVAQAIAGGPGWDTARDSLSFPTFRQDYIRELSVNLFGAQISPQFGYLRINLGIWQIFTMSGQCTTRSEENCMTACFYSQTHQAWKTRKYEGFVVLKLLVFALFIMPPNEKAALLCML